MKLSAILCKQHIGRHFKKHWIVQGKRKILPTPAEQILAENGIPVHKPEDIYNEKREFQKVEIVGFKPKPVKFDESHPNWHDRQLLTFNDTNVLLEGLSQAQVLTKTVKLAEGLPEGYVLNPVSKDLNKRFKEIIFSSHVFDAEQQKLPKRKDPTRPAWNFPRDFGITHSRRCKLMTSKLIHLLESNENNDLVKQRYFLHDLFFSYNFEKGNDLIQLQLTGDNVIVTPKPLSQITPHPTEDVNLPNLYPLKCTTTLNEENIYKLENIYPINKSVKARYPHTVFVHYDITKVKNLFEEEVTETQFHCRSLLKTFTVAASFAKQEYGENTKELPSPLTVQCVHTDGRLFQFGVLQLNTLNFENEGIKNIWYQTENLPLFEICQYEGGKPVLKGYNTEVLQHLITFYNKC